jgi:hypothetical protein
MTGALIGNRATKWAACLVLWYNCTRSTRLYFEFHTLEPMGEAVLPLNQPSLPPMALKPRPMANMNKRSALARFATLLGSFRLKELHQRTTKDMNDCLSTLASQESDFSCSVPSLSLTSLSHSNGVNHPHRGARKNAVEEHASSNLARSLVATGTTEKTRATVATHMDSTPNVTCEEFVTLSDLPHQMLDNLAGSFLTLTDARLRAYISILARHGVSLSSCPALSRDEQKEGVLAVERKLETLIQVGTGVTIDNMVTFFRLDNSQSEQDDKGFPLVLETTMDVCIPKTCGGDQIVTVGASAKGWITGTSCADWFRHSISTQQTFL